jgi:hypothetical protein
MAPRRKRVCDIFLPQRKTNLGAVHHSRRTGVPDALQRSFSVAAQSRDLAPTVWAPAQQRTTPRRRGALRCVRGTRRPFHLQTYLRDLAAYSARVFLSVSPLIANKGRREGRAPAGTQGPHAEDARGVTTGDAGRPAFPAQWFYGLWRALPGERCTVAPVVLRMIDARARSGGSPPQALTPACGRQDHTLLPSADVPPLTSGSSRVLAPEAEKKRCDRTVSIPRIVMAHGGRPPCHPVTRRRYRVHRLPAHVS